VASNGNKIFRNQVADDRPAFTGVERREFFGTSASEALATTPALLSKVIDADVRRLPDGRWKMWFKDLKVQRRSLIRVN